MLQPYLIGTNVGLHPVWLMFALFAFGLLFGFVGLLMAIPAGGGGRRARPLCACRAISRARSTAARAATAARDDRDPPGTQLTLGLSPRTDDRPGRFRDRAGQCRGDRADRGRCRTGRCAASLLVGPEGSGKIASRRDLVRSPPAPLGSQRRTSMTPADRLTAGGVRAVEDLACRSDRRAGAVPSPQPRRRARREGPDHQPRRPGHLAADLADLVSRLRAMRLVDARRAGRRPAPPGADQALRRPPA